MSDLEPTLPIGYILEGRYRIVSEGIDRDIGTEYKAYDLHQERLAAVVCLAPHLGGGMEAARRLVTANQAVADLTQPAIIPYDRIGLVGGQFYVARSHTEAQSLADLLAKGGGSLPAEAAVDVGIRLCEALALVHRAGLVHGGLSPHSVLVGTGGEVYLLDCGLVLALRPAPSTPGQPWGRAPYLSPEQAGGLDALPASDVYAAGSLLYQMLVGRPPFTATDMMVLAVQHLRQDPPSLPVLMPQVPLPLAQIVHKALAKEPSARYRNAGQLAHILRTQSGQQQAATPPPAYVPPPPVHQAPVVVPPPPPAYQAWQVQGPEGVPGSRAEQDEGVDWLLVALIIAALIAVLGLIPLWRTVLSRYTVPAPVQAPAGVREGVPGSAALWSGPRDGGSATGFETAPVRGAAKLDGSGLIWYNFMLWPQAGDDLPSLGVQLTGAGRSL